MKKVWPIKEDMRLSNFELAITEMHPWIPWELVANPLGSAERTLVATSLKQWHRK